MYVLGIYRIRRVHCEPYSAAILEMIEVFADQAAVSIRGVVVSPFLREISLTQCRLADTEPSIPPSSVNRTVTKRNLFPCTFPNEASLLLLQQFQGLENLHFGDCCSPVAEQRAPWFNLIRGLPSLRQFHALADSSAANSDSPVFPSDPLLSSVASALAIRDKPLDLDLYLASPSRFAPSLYDLIRHSWGSVERDLADGRWSTWITFAGVCRLPTAGYRKLICVWILPPCVTGALRRCLRPPRAAGTSRF